MNALAATGEFAGRLGHLPNGEHIEWWPTGWLAIADDGGGDLVCLDLRAQSRSHAGHVVVFHHASRSRDVLAPTYASWLSTLADRMEAGDYHYAPDECG